MNSRPRHFERLLKFLRRKGRSHEDAEDLIQEAMLRLHVYAQTEPVANEEAFLKAAVRNLAIDHHRRHRPDLGREVPFDDVDTRQLPITTECPLESQVQAQQRLNTIQTLLDTASRRTRDIYFAHRAGYTYAEIGAHMRISHITIKRHIARALVVIMDEGPFD